MALVMDLSLMLPLFDLISSSSSAGLTKWNTLSSSSRAFPVHGGKEHLLYGIPPPIYSCTLSQYAYENLCQLNFNAELKKNKKNQLEMLNNQVFGDAYKSVENKVILESM